MTRDQAYWISPSGKIIDVVNVENRESGDSSTLHIGAIVRDPEIFGLTKEEVQKVYDKYGETVGSEHKAREDILIMAMNIGWIRVRYYSRKSYWTIQFNGDFSTRKKENIWSFLVKGSKLDDGEGIDGVSMHKDDFVYVTNGAGEIVLKPDRIVVVASEIFPKENKLPSSLGKLFEGMRIVNPRNYKINS